MKATIYWKDNFTKKRHQKTFLTDKNEPNHIVRLAREKKYLTRWVYITGIKCGRKYYMDYGEPCLIKEDYQ